MELIIDPRVRKQVEHFDKLGQRLMQKYAKDPNTRIAYSPAHRIERVLPIVVKSTEREDDGETMHMKAFDLEGNLVTEKSIPKWDWRTGTVASSEKHFGTEKPSKAEVEAHPLLAQHHQELEELNQQIVRELDLTPDSRVIEFGPGEGELIHEVLKTGATVTAIDHTPLIVKKLKQRFENAERNGKLEIKQAQYTEAPKERDWRYGQATHAVSMFSTELHPHSTAMFKLIKAALRKGGKYVITEITPFHSELRRHLEKAGFKVEKVHVTGNTVGTPIETYFTTITCRKP